MALTYEASAALMSDQLFRGRIKVAALKFATYVKAEAPTVEGHSARYRWAQRMALQPDATATELQPNVVMEPAVQADGAAIDDTELQTAVEAVIKTFF